MGRLAFDSFTISETASRLLVASRSVQDAFTIVDAAVGWRHFTGSLSDSFAVADSVNRLAQAFGRNTSDAWVVSDSAQKGGNLFVASTDSWTLFDVVLDFVFPENLIGATVVLSVSQNYVAVMKVQQRESASLTVFEVESANLEAAQL